MRDTPQESLCDRLVEFTAAMGIREAEELSLGLMDGAFDIK
jgi:hypothetical protein